MMYGMDYVASGWCYACEQDVIGFTSPLHRPDQTAYPALYAYQHNWDGVTTDYDMQEKLVDGPLKFLEQGIPASILSGGLPFVAQLYLHNDAPGEPRDQNDGFSRWAPYESVLTALESGGTESWDAACEVPWIGGTATSAFSGYFFSVAPGLPLGPRQRGRRTADGSPTTLRTKAASEPSRLHQPPEARNAGCSRALWHRACQRGRLMAGSSTSQPTPTAPRTSGASGSTLRQDTPAARPSQ